MKNEFVVQTKNLCKVFAGKEVIHDRTMSVERVTIYGFLGKNDGIQNPVRVIKTHYGRSKRFRHGQQQKQFGGIKADRKSDRNTDLL